MSYVNAILAWVLTVQLCAAAQRHLDRRWPMPPRLVRDTRIVAHERNTR